MAHNYIMPAWVLHRDSGKTPVLRHVVDKLYRRMAKMGLRFSYVEVFLFVMPFLKAEEDKHRHEREYGRQRHRVRAMSSERESFRSRSRSPHGGRSSLYRPRSWGRDRNELQSGGDRHRDRRGSALDLRHRSGDGCNERSSKTGNPPSRPYERHRSLSTPNRDTHNDKCGAPDYGNRTGHRPDRRRHTPEGNRYGSSGGRQNSASGGRRNTGGNPHQKREVLPVAHAADLQVRQNGIVQLTTARIVVGLDIGPNSVGIRVIKVGIRGHRTGRIGKTVHAPVIKGPHLESELDLQVPGQGRETSAGQIHPTPRAVGPKTVRVTPGEKAKPLQQFAGRPPEFQKGKCGTITCSGRKMGAAQGVARWSSMANGCLQCVTYRFGWPSYWASA